MHSKFRAMHFIAIALGRAFWGQYPFVITSRCSIVRFAHWTVFESRFCGFAAQKYSTKPQLKNCRLARRYKGRFLFYSASEKLRLISSCHSSWFVQITQLANICENVVLFLKCTIYRARLASVLKLFVRFASEFMFACASLRVRLN